jgi:uncharacterized protein YyaL (SSP411 family)
MKEIIMKKFLLLSTIALSIVACSAGDAKKDTTPPVKQEKKIENVKVKNTLPAKTKAAEVKNVSKEDGIVWVTDVNKAFELSQKLNKPVFAFFTGKEWCGWCKRLVAQVFVHKEFYDYANEEYIMLELDFPRRDRSKITPEMVQLARSLDVKGYPSIYLITPDKKVLGKTGYQNMTPKQYIAHLEAMRK